MMDMECNFFPVSDVGLITNTARTGSLELFDFFIILFYYCWIHLFNFILILFFFIAIRSNLREGAFLSFTEANAIPVKYCIYFDKSKRLATVQEGDNIASIEDEETETSDGGESSQFG